MQTGAVPLGVAVAQFAPGPDREANLRVMDGLAARAAARGARLVVFPEYSAFFLPELGPAWLAAAEPLDGPFTRELGRIARELGIVVVAGFGEALEGPSAVDGRFSNTVVAVGQDGFIASVYRKLHLYDAFGARESDWIVPGPIDAPAVFVLEGVRIGIQTCYDLRFPEVTRRLADVGAELVVVPSEWVRGPLKEAHWRTLITARAIENTIYVAAPDHAPPVGAGNSMIVDPMGVELVTIGEQTDVALTWVSVDRVAEVREINPSLGLRRFRVLPAE
jgi:deaminated glutathione amidase